MLENDVQLHVEPDKLPDSPPQDDKGVLEEFSAMEGANAPNYYAQVIASFFNRQYPWVRANELPKLFCSWDLAYRCTSNGWLKPIVQGKRRTIYRLVDVLSCMRRIEAGEFPSARIKRGVR